MVWEEVLYFGSSPDERAPSYLNQRKARYRDGSFGYPYFNEDISFRVI